MCFRTATQRPISDIRLGLAVPFARAMYVLTVEGVGTNAIGNEIPAAAHARYARFRFGEWRVRRHAVRLRKSLA